MNDELNVKNEKMKNPEMGPSPHVSLNSRYLRWLLWLAMAIVILDCLIKLLTRVW